VLENQVGEMRVLENQVLTTRQEYTRDGTGSAKRGRGRGEQEVLER
jgi:hypothetical protein